MKYLIMLFLAFFPMVSLIDTTFWIFAGDRLIVTGEVGNELMFRVVVLSLISTLTGGLLLSILADMAEEKSKQRK